MKKTLGGDRLGSGSKMKVDLHNYERSTHDLSYVWRSTMSVGTLVPFMSEIALPGDTFDINLQADCKTHPTIGPLFGSAKVQLDVFVAPIRLYNALLHNNKLGIGLNMAQVKLPKIRLNIPTNTIVEDPWKNIDNSQINPSCLLAYLGIRGVGANVSATDATRLFNAVPILAYWEIYKNYYANKQEEIGAVIHTPTFENPDVHKVFIGTTEIPSELETPINRVIDNLAPIDLIIEFEDVPEFPENVIFITDQGDISANDFKIGGWVEGSHGGYNSLESDVNITRYNGIVVKKWRLRRQSDMNVTQPQVTTFDLSEIDRMREEILKKGSQEVIIGNFGGDLPTMYPYVFLYEDGTPAPARLSSQEGLGLKTYQSDILQNWLQTEWIDGTTGINAITAIDTSEGSFTIDTLNLSKKVYDMLNRIAVSGGSYDDWIDAVYTHDRYKRAESPMYMGGLIKELVFQEVISNSQSTEQPLGTLAGRGVLSSKHKGGNIVINIDEPSYIMGIVSITPRIDYSQGNKWDVNLNTLDDLHKPALDEIGFQELITEQMAWWGTYFDGTWKTTSAGKQPAWINYMSNYNRTYGNFAVADNEMFMTFNRRYETLPDAPEFKDLTTYIDPVKFNFIFAETALDAQNFWMQIGCNITARRKMSAKVMPNL